MIAANGNAFDNPPTIAVGVPCGDLVHTWFALDLAMLVRQGIPEGNRIALIRGSSSIIVQARNNVVAAAQSAGAQWLMFLDSDMRFPFDILRRLRAHDKDIVGCAYKRRTPPYETMGRPLVDRKIEVDEGLVAMRHLPLGVMLIRMSVFDRLTKPYFRIPFVEGEDNYGEDLDFCNRAREAGFQVWCDVSASNEIGHLGLVTFTEAGLPEMEAAKQIVEQKAQEARPQ
jgi:hypothetical protein